MKRILQYLLIFTVALTQVACEGEEGPEGPPGPAGPVGAQGPQGPAGESTTAQVFEIAVDFTAENQYEFGFDIADYNEALETEVVINESDIILAFMAIGAIEDQPLWGALPQTFSPAAGQVSYRFANADQVLVLYMDATDATLAALPEQYTTNQYFRLVVIPGELMNGRKAQPAVDLSNYKKVLEYYHIDDTKVQKLKSK